MAQLAPEECRKAQCSYIQTLDRFSNLPESIIHHIFSFLEMNGIAQIGVLSKRCRQMFVCSPYLTFKSSSCSRDDPLKCKQFRDHVDNFLRCRDGLEIHSLCLHWQCYSHKCFVEMNYAHKWIDIAVSCQVRELDLKVGAMRFHDVGPSQHFDHDFEFGAGEEDADFDPEYGIREDSVFDIPQCLFNSKFLRVLKLSLNGHHLKKPTGVFASLEELSMEMVAVTDNSLKEWISMACVSLKRLTLVDLYKIRNIIIINRCLEGLTLSELSDLHSIDITADRLQSLYMGLGPILPGYLCTLKINAPSLSDLRWATLSPNNIYLSEFKYLHSATISVGVDDGYIGKVTARNRLAELIRQMRFARVLQINIDALEILFVNNRLSVVFDNLQHLVVTVHSLQNYHFPVLASVLMGSLNLETLSIKCRESRYKPYYVKRLKTKASEFCKRHEGFHNLIGHQLKEIEIELQGKGHQVRLVEILVKIAKGLKKITVFYSGDNLMMLSKNGLQKSRATFQPLEVNFVEKEFQVENSYLFSFE